MGCGVVKTLCERSERKSVAKKASKVLENRDFSRKSPNREGKSSLIGEGVVARECFDNHAEGGKKFWGEGTFSRAIKMFAKKQSLRFRKFEIFRRRIQCGVGCSEIEIHHLFGWGSRKSALIAQVGDKEAQKSTHTAFNTPVARCFLIVNKFNFIAHKVKKKQRRGFLFDIFTL